MTTPSTTAVKLHKERALADLNKRLADWLLAYPNVADTVRVEVGLQHQSIASLRVPDPLPPLKLA
jgi:hypothetical protein